MRLFNLINSLNSGIKNCELWYLVQYHDLFSGALKSYNLAIRRAPQSLLPKRSLWDNILKKIDTVPPAPFDLVINLGSNFYETMQIVKSQRSASFHQPGDFYSAVAMAITKNTK